MSGCLDHCDCRCPDWACFEYLRDIEWSDQRNRFASIVAGIFFFVGWWIAIDSAVYPFWSMPQVLHVIGVVGTIAFFMVNAVSSTQLSSDTYAEGCIGQRGARVWLFIGFVLAFGALIAAAWVLFGMYVVPSIDRSHHPTTPSTPTPMFSTTNGTGNHTTAMPPSDGVGPVWIGVAVMLENLFIFIGSMIFKFGRSEELWE
ncbi:transmembrane protein 50A-like [Oscarella lobularis]|uniref:transmembrane protein 50A-like n=1 Tax=Oscarella lobularis TaxID=121494 RepID=UPI0033132A24